MSNSSAFVIPAGLVLQQEGDAVSIEHSGDIILHGTLGLPIRRVRSTGGNVELHTDAALTEIEAAGSVIVGSDLAVERLSGSRIEIRGGVKAQTLTVGDGGAQIEGDLQVDTLSASGDVTVQGSLHAQHVSTRGASLRLSGDATAQTITVSGGDLIAGGSLQVDDASASDGSLSIGADVTARRISAQTVTLSGSSAQVSVVQGAQSITVGDTHIRADILIAPRVQLSASTSGKITVVESRNSPTPSAVKGCLSLADLEEFGLDAESFLRERNLSPLPDGDAPAEVAAPAPAAAEPAPAADADEDDDVAAAVAQELEAAAAAAAAEAAAAEAAAAAAVIETLAVDAADEDSNGADDGEYLSALSHADFLGEDEAPPAEADGALDIDLDISMAEMTLDSEDEEDADGTDDDFGELDISLEGEELEPLPASVSIMDDDPGELEMADGQEIFASEGVEQLFDLSMEEQEETSEEDPIYVEMLETVRRIEGCYDGSELPPAVTQLGEMVEARNYEGIRDDITNIWNQLLKFHQKRGLRIQPQVTTTFNTINTIVRRI